MALGESYKLLDISQNSWIDGFSQDPYFWLENSFQYAENLNCDDEMHGVKLAQKYKEITQGYKESTPGSGTFDTLVNIDLSSCQIVSVWDRIIALPLDNRWKKVKVVWWDDNNNRLLIYSENAWPTPIIWWLVSWVRTAPWTIFQDYFWYGVEFDIEEDDGEGWTVVNHYTAICKIHPKQLTSAYTLYTPWDHNDITDEAIRQSSTTTTRMKWAIWAILNYNNTRLIVWAWQDVWVYYPELDKTNDWETWWLKTLHFENWCDVIWLSCDFQFLKVWVQDEWWNTKVYFYQGNNNLRSTYVYNLIDLTWQKILRVYSVNGTDYYTSSMDGSSAYITFNKLIWKTPVQLFKQKKWLTKYDVNYKAQYFVWPTWVWAPYNSWSFYINDAYWIFKFNQSQDSYDTGYMKWRINNQITASNQAYGIDCCKNFLYISYEDKFYVVRLYDTGVDWYESTWILISREFEWTMWWTFTKMLNEVRLHYELIPDYIFNNESNWNGKIEIFVSPNNLWESTSFSSNWWYKVMEINKKWNKTRTEKTNKLNNWSNIDAWAFGFDWQTITFWIKITRWSQTQCTPVVREVKLIYSLKGKTNFNYDIWQE